MAASLRVAFASLFVALPAAAVAFNWTNPPGPQFSPAEKAAQLRLGATVLPTFSACFASGAAVCTLAPGDYRFPPARDWQLELVGFLRPAAAPLTLSLRGVTFWFTTPAMAPPFANIVGAKLLRVQNCSHLVIDGLTIDSDPRGSIEGRVVEVDAPNNRVRLAVSPGSFFAPVVVPANATDAWFRFIPFTSRGEHMAPLYPLQRARGLSVASLTPLDVDNTTWCTFSRDALLPTSLDPAWRSAYGDFGSLGVDSGIALVSYFGQGITLDRSARVTLLGVTNHAVKAGLNFWGGDGGHVVRNYVSAPRPNTNQLLGGDGCNALAGRTGPVFDNVTFVTSTDDLMNFHSAFIAVTAVTGKTVAFAPSGGAGPNDESTNSYVIGEARLGDTVAFYDKSAQLLAEATVEAALGSTVLTLTSAPPASVGAGTFAYLPSAACANWSVTNSRFIDMFQRILVMSGPGRFVNNTVIREGSGFAAGSPMPAPGGGASGIPRGLEVSGNTFIDSAPAPWGSYFDGGSMLPITIGDPSPWGQQLIGAGFVVTNNTIVRAGGNAIGLFNATDALVSDNVIVDPLAATVVVNGTGARGVPFQAIFVRHSANVAVAGNVLRETGPAPVCVPDPVTRSAVLGLGDGNTNVTLNGRPVA